MTSAAATPEPAPFRRRDMQKEQTRLDLALAAFELAKAHGLANVRVPQIAAAAGVSPRTFNNYFASKEAAIVWPTTLRGARMAEHLAGRPAGELLADALVATVADLYEPGEPDHIPAGWLQEFRAMVGAEPSLHGEYLKAAAASERALAASIARRTGADQADLRPLVLAAVVVAAERAAILQWFRQAGTPGQLVDMVRAAVGLAVRGPAAPDATLT
jgi:AcrR family transcriptional regulator